MCILKGIDAEIFHENLNNPNHPLDEEIKQVRKWAGIEQVEINVFQHTCKKSHVIFLHDKSNKKDFWQKVWMIKNYMKRLGFEYK